MKSQMTSQSKKECRYLIMAGGTGGHIFPAIAVAKALRDRGADVYWLGTHAGMEQTIVPKENFPLHEITIKGFRGKGFLAKLMAPLLLLFSIIQALCVMVKLKPQVVVGFGGYVAAPGGIAARLLTKPLIIHEQNSVAGSTNKLLAKLTNKVLEAFPGSLPKATLVGNPVRDEVKQLMAKKKGSTKNINVLVTGGSLGAQSINELMPKVFQRLPDQLRPNIWHQTGKGKIQNVIESYQQHDIDAKVEEFIQQVEIAYDWADVVICRAGALTVSEVAVAGVPAIFIPYPYAIDNHQSTNALWLVNNGASLMIEQADLTVEVMVKRLTDLLQQPNKLQAMSEKLQQLAMPNATEDVVSVCEQACGKENRHAA